MVQKVSVWHRLSVVIILLFLSAGVLSAQSSELPDEIKSQKIKIGVQPNVL